MVKVLRCPACGALWRVETDQKQSLFRCTECQSTFAKEKAECVEVDETLLEERLALEETKKDALEQKSEEAAVTMSRLAEELSDFDSRKTEDKPVEKQIKDEGSKFSFLWVLLSLIAILALCAAALLFAHKAVLNKVPQLRSAYEQVCSELPCPGFVWMNADAFSVQAKIEHPETNANDLEREMSGLLPVVVAEIRNASLHPQYLPILELKLTDAAGETMAQRILEPKEYGFESLSVLAPGDHIFARLTILTPLPYQASGVIVTPVSDLR